MWYLVVRWWNLLFLEPQKSKQEILRDLFGGVTIKDQKSQESNVEEAMQLAKKMIAALDEAVETLKQEEARDGESVDA